MWHPHIQLLQVIHFLVQEHFNLTQESLQTFLHIPGGPVFTVLAKCVFKLYFYLWNEWQYRFIICTLSCICHLFLKDHYMMKLLLLQFLLSSSLMPLSLCFLFCFLILPVHVRTPSSACSNPVYSLWFCCNFGFLKNTVNDFMLQ